MATLDDVLIKSGDILATTIGSNTLADQAQIYGTVIEATTRFEGLINTGTGSSTINDLTITGIVNAAQKINANGGIEGIMTINATSTMDLSDITNSDIGVGGNAAGDFSDASEGRFTLLSAGTSITAPLITASNKFEGSIEGAVDARNTVTGAASATQSYFDLLDTTNDLYVGGDITMSATSKITAQELEILGTVDFNNLLVKSNLDVRGNFALGPNVDEQVSSPATSTFSVNSSTGAVEIGDTTAPNTNATLLVQGAITGKDDLLIEGNTTLGNANTDTLSLNAKLATSIFFSASNLEIGDTTNRVNKIYASEINTDGNVVVNGDLTVVGATTTLTTEEIKLADAKIELNSNATGAEDSGLRINLSGGVFKEFLWNANDANWDFGSTNRLVGKEVRADLLDSTNSVMVNSLTRHVDVATIDTSGLADIAVLSVANNATIGANLDVTGTTRLRSTVTVDSLSTANAILVADGSGTLTIDAGFRFTGTDFLIGPSGATVFGVNATTGSTDIAQDLTVGNDIDITGGDFRVNTNKFIITNAGNTDIAGTLDVALAADFDASLDVATTLAVGGVATFTSLINANDGIAVDTNKFTVDGGTGAIATLSTLTVGGAAALNSGITVNGTKMTVDHVTGNVATEGSLTVDVLTTSEDIRVNTLAGNQIVFANASKDLTGDSNFAYDTSNFIIGVDKFDVEVASGSIVTKGSITTESGIVIEDAGTLVIKDALAPANNTFTVQGASGNIASSGTLTLNDATNPSRIAAGGLQLGNTTTNRVLISGASELVTDSADLTFTPTLFNISQGKFTVTRSDGSVFTDANLQAEGTTTLNILNVSGDTAVTSTTQSTNTSSGALQVSGGVAISKNLFVGGDANLGSNIQATGGELLSVSLGSNPFPVNIIATSTDTVDLTASGIITGSYETGTTYSVDINNGSIDGTTIGADEANASTITGTIVKAKTNFVGNINTTTGSVGTDFLVDTILTGNLTVNNPGAGTSTATFNGDVSIFGDTTLRGGNIDDTIIGASTPRNITGLTIVADTRFEGNIDATGTEATLDQPTFVDQQVTGIFRNDSITSDAYFRNLNVAGNFSPTNIDLAGNLDVTGNVNFKTEIININSDQTAGQNIGFRAKSSLGDKDFVWADSTTRWTIGSETFQGGTIVATVGFTGDVTGDLTGDVFASNGTTKILETGNGTTVPAAYTGNVTGDIQGTINNSTLTNTMGSVDALLDLSTFHSIVVNNTLQTVGEYTASGGIVGNIKGNILSTNTSGVILNTAAATAVYTGDVIGNLTGGTNIQSIAFTSSGLGKFNSAEVDTTLEVTGLITATTGIEGNIKGSLRSAADNAIVVDTSAATAEFTGDLTGDVNATHIDTTTITTLGLATLQSAQINTSLTATGVINANGGLTGNITSSGVSTFSGTVNLNGATVSNALFDLTGDLTGNADTATELDHSVTYNVTGAVAGSVTTTLSGNTVNIATTAQADQFTLGTHTVGTYASEVTVTGVGLTATPVGATDGTAYIITSNATNNNTVNTIVSRDAQGDFSAGIITAATLIGDVQGDVENSDGTVILDAGSDLVLAEFTGNVTAASGTSEFNDVTINSTATIDKVDIGTLGNIGTIDYTTIGATGAAAGTFTTVDGTTITASIGFDGDLTGDLLASDGSTLINHVTKAIAVSNLDAIIGANAPTTATFTDVTATGAVNLTGATTTIDGGTINGTIIGGATAAAGTFTDLVAGTIDTGAGSIDGGTITGAAFVGPLTGAVTGTIGAGTKNTGGFTDLTTTGSAIIGTTLTVEGGLAKLDNVDINGGAIDGTTIGASVPDRTTIGATTIDGTVISASTSFEGKVGVSGQDTGAFTTIDATEITSSGDINISAGIGKLFIGGGTAVIDNNKDAVLNDLTLTGAFAPGTINVGSGNFTVDAVGNAVIAGDLTIGGSTTTVNTETILLADNIIVLNSNATVAESGGININLSGGISKELIWNQTDGAWSIGTEEFKAGTFTASTQIDAPTINATTFNGALVGNATTASAWQTARTITFAGGDVTGTFTTDGSGDISNIALTVEANSVALGTDTTGSYVEQATTAGNGISGSVNTEAGTFTVTSNATDTNLPSTTVFRDASGDFSAGTITANLTGDVTGSIGATTRDTGEFTTIETDNNVSVGGSLTVTSVTNLNDNVSVATGKTLSSDTVAFTGGTINGTTIGTAIGGAAAITGTTIIANTGFTGDITGDVISSNTSSTILDTSGATAVFTGNVVGNVDTTTAMSSAVTVALTGPITGSATFTNAGDTASIATTITNDSVTLGTHTAGSYVEQAATSGNGISGSVNTEAGTFTVTSNATDANTPSTTVFRDASGDFSAGMITADVTGDIYNSGSNKVLETGISSVDAIFTGNVNITAGTSNFNNVTANDIAVSTKFTADITNGVSITDGAITGTTIGSAVGGDQATIYGTTITASSGFIGNITGNVTGDLLSGGDVIDGNVTVGTGNTLGVTGTFTVAPGSTGSTLNNVVIGNITPVNAFFDNVESSTVDTGTGTIDGGIITAATKLVGDLNETNTTKNGFLNNFTSTGLATFNNVSIGGNISFADLNIGGMLTAEGGLNIDTETFTLSADAQLGASAVAGMVINRDTAGDVRFIWQENASQTGGTWSTEAQSLYVGNDLEVGDELTVANDITITTGALIGDVTSTNVDITGGTIKATTIGSATGADQAAGYFTTINTASDVTIGGNLTVNGGVTSITSTELRLTDKVIVVADGATDSATGDGAGFTIGTSGIGITYSHANTRFVVSEDLRVNGVVNANNYVGSITSAASDVADFSAASSVSFANDAISGDAINGGTIGGITVTNLVSSNVNISGGAIVSTTIGELGRSTGKFTTIDANSTINATGNISAGTMTATTFTGALVGNADTVTNGVYTTDAGTVTNTMLAGSIANAKLVNDDVTIGTTAIALGAGSTTLAGLTSVTSTNFVGNLDGDLTGDVIAGDASVLINHTTKFLNGNVNTSTGTTTLNNLTTGGAIISNGTATFNGALEVTAGNTATFDDITINGDLSFSNLTLPGNLEVQGDADFYASTITLNSDSGVDVDAGIVVNRNGGGSVSFVYDTSASRWSTGNTDLTASMFYGDVTGDISGAVTSSNVTITGGSIGSTTIGASGTASTGVFTQMDTVNAQITGGNIINTQIGDNSNRDVGYFTNVFASNTLNGNLSGNVTSTGASSFDNITIAGGAINNTTIGSTTHVSGKFTTLEATNGLTIAGTTNSSGAINTTNNISGAVVTATTRFDGDLTGDVTGTVTSIANHSTADLAEDPSATTSSGTMYYTDARVDAHLVGGTGVTYSGGNISIGQDVSVTSNVTFNDVDVDGTLTVASLSFTDLTVTGDLTVQGLTTSLETETIELADNIILLNSNATGSATANAGLEVERGSDVNVSFVWDESNDRWTLAGEDLVANTFIGDLTGDVAGNVTSTSGTSNFVNIVSATGDITATTGTISAPVGGFTGNVTGTVSTLSNHDTGDLTEGTNLYYTDARVENRLNGNLLTSIIPNADDTYDLGNSDFKWRDLYLGPNSINMEGRNIVSLDVLNNTFKFEGQSNDSINVKATGTGDVLLTAANYIKLEGMVQLPFSKHLSTEVVAAGDFNVNYKYTIRTSGTTDWNAAAGTTGITYNAGDVFTAANAGSGSGTAYEEFLSVQTTIDMHDQKIINLGTPTDASDAATKDYVDNFNTTLTISGDVGADDAVSLQNDILEFQGASDQIETNIFNNRVRFELRDNIKTQTYTSLNGLINLEANASNNSFVTFDSSQTGTPASAGQHGLVVDRGTATNATILWNESFDRWKFSNGGSEYNIPTPSEYDRYDQWRLVGDSGDLVFAGSDDYVKFAEGTSDGVTLDVDVTNLGAAATTSTTPHTVEFNITNTDKGSSQNIYKTISVQNEFGTDQSLDSTANSNTDTLTFREGAGIAITRPSADVYQIAHTSVGAADIDANPSNGSYTFINDLEVTIDSEGHVTNTNVGTKTLDLTWHFLDSDGTDHDVILDDTANHAIKLVDTGGITANWTQTANGSISTPATLELKINDTKIDSDLSFNDTYGINFGTGTDGELFFDGTSLNLDMNGSETILIRDGANSNTNRFSFDTATGDFTATGDVTAFSDARLKDNVETIDNALDKVTAMRGVTFDKDGKKGTGVIAQEIEEILPEVVNNNGEYKSVAYGNIVGTLIEAIKELKAEIEELKKGKA